MSRRPSFHLEVGNDMSQYMVFANPYEAQEVALKLNLICYSMGEFENAVKQQSFIEAILNDELDVSVKTRVDSTNRYMAHKIETIMNKVPNGTITISRGTNNKGEVDYFCYTHTYFDRDTKIHDLIDKMLNKVFPF